LCCIISRQVFSYNWPSVKAYPQAYPHHSQNQNLTNYNNLLHQMFDPTDGAATGALNYIRIPIGASDFSANGEHTFFTHSWLCQPLTIIPGNAVYSWDDSAGDTRFNSFSVEAPSYVWTVLGDIVAINNLVKIHLCPWSPVRRVRPCRPVELMVLRRMILLYL
jgi:hypothetical protein